MYTISHPKSSPLPWLLPSTFTLQLDMDSDWHVGSGTGRPGSVDRLIARDHEELPYIPAKTLTGIWRDALERLVHALDNGRAHGAWAAWVEALFGSQPALATGAQATAPRPATLEISPAQLALALRTQLRGQERTVLRQALTFVKPGVSIDARSGQALSKHLRFEEMARTGTRLSARCTWRPPISSAQHAAASALLIASAGLVEHLGGKRRRGAGRCAMTLTLPGSTPAPADVVPWLQAHLQPPALTDWEADSAALTPGSAGILPAPQAGETPALPGTAETAVWLSLPMTLTVQTPLAIAARTLGNVTETLDYVPGTLLLPYVTRTLQALGYEACQPAVASGMLQVLPATIDVQDQRGLPVPLVLFQPKGANGFDTPGTLVNRLRQPLPEDTQNKAVGQGYVGAWGHPGLPPYRTVPQVLLTHNTVEDAVQRPTSDVGGVYSREAIAAGVRLHTELRLHPDVAQALAACHTNWWQQLGGECRIGVSRKDDYGLVQIEVHGPPSSAARIGQGQGEATTPSDRLTVWLLSDVLLRDAALRPTVDSTRLGHVLGEHLGVRLTAITPAAGCLGELLHTHRVESWHTRWGQPRPSLIAMAAGSCAVLQVTGTLDPARLREVEMSGIGERRGEGYGQVCLNAALLTSELQTWPVAASPEQRQDAIPAALTQAEDAEVYRYAQRLELTAWREALHRTVLGVAADEQWRQEILHLEISREPNRQSRPPLSQLGSVRTMLADLHSAAERDRILQRLAHLEHTPNRRDKWPDQGLDALKTLLRDPEQVWEVLKPHWQEPPVLTEAGDPAMKRRQELQHELWAETVRTLVDACFRAHKRATEEETPHGA